MIVTTGNTHRLLARFFFDRRGNIAVIFALALLPLLSFVGAAVDYSLAARARAKLAAALDTAVLVATAKSEITRSTSAAQSDALNTFNGQMSALGMSSSSITINVVDSVTTRTATGTATATVPTYFMGILGYKTMGISATSTAAASLPAYIDFYVLLDNSPSQGLAATTTGMTALQNATSDSCAFACHDIYTSSSKKTVQTNSYYSIAKNLGIKMRIDLVRDATQSLTDTATASQLVSNQYRMAVYTMGSDCSSIGLTTISALTSSLSSVKTAVSAVDLMTIPYTNYNSDMCTDFDGILSSMNTTIPTPGDGSSSSPQKWLFFVSDGVADYYYPSSCSKTVISPGRCQEPLTTTICDTIKARGVKIAVLYTTYLAITNNGWYNTYIAPWRSSIGTTMQSCATSGYYYEVSSDSSISDALNALFQKAIAASHLTN
ncbi:TadE/TadG family type IV pilus assembly protein [Bradyrhizobium sp. GCM10027634]|uniref:TadE/TadG family type IV pilus assembly protein n=1 Tax=unclassified Bradyrhizobium TaxID=2631580 RepID=UPI00188DA2E1|nr:MULTISPECIES: TadE/TadG family type IV pilus assembly protein [unclassified Bradyrhizobium]MDN5000751.1 pilus assembly protein [Bradyrhizobium sp. WYCCWR 12677]QOZ42530.1 pilus assembly protein [Bradyrhizobium sp. CCBAU 53340]